MCVCVYLFKHICNPGVVRRETKSDIRIYIYNIYVCIYICKSTHQAASKNIQGALVNLRIRARKRQCTCEGQQWEVESPHVFFRYDSSWTRLPQG